MKCPECQATTIIGIEVWGVYDGVLYWICETCDNAWARDWTGYGRRQDIANEHVKKHNADRLRRR